MTTLEKLTLGIREVFDDDEISYGPATTANDIDRWDSLSHVNLVLAIEARFGIRFSQKELLGFKNVGYLHKSIEAKISG